MPEAKQLHKRAHNMVGKKTVDAPSIKIPVTEAVVVKVLPTEKHESFEDFYPLHVTKVDSVKENTGMRPLIIGIVLIIVVGVAAFWYVKQQEFADTGAPFHMPIISPTAVDTLLETPAVTETPIVTPTETDVPTDSLTLTPTTTTTSTTPDTTSITP